MTYEIGNPGPDLGQPQKCGGVNPVNGIPNYNSEVFKFCILIKSGIFYLT
jgi:hypothetical protein